MAINSFSVRVYQFQNITDESGVSELKLNEVDSLTLINTAWYEMLKDEPIIKVIFAEGQRPCKVEVDDITYYPWYILGSDSKQGGFYCVTRDVMKDAAKYAEDSMRGGRWLLAQGWYGFGKKSLKIKAVQKGQLFNGLPIEDGFGYITSKLANELYTGQPKIELGTGKGSYTFWQNIPPTQAVKDALKPYIEKASQDFQSLYMALDYSDLDDAKKWASLADDMLYHPSVVNPLRRSLAEWLARRVTTPNVKVHTKVAVPTTCNSIASTTSVVSWRNPIDQFGSIQAVRGDKNAVQEEKRIQDLEVVQYSLTNDTSSWKGCLGITDDLDGYDIVFCSDDQKMGEFVDDGTVEGYLTFLSWWNKGSAIGVSAEWAKDLMGLDHDGDILQYIVATKDLWPVFEEAEKLPKWETPKIPKLKSERTDENMAEYAWNVFCNLVGYATNTRSHAMGFYSNMGDQELLAEWMGYSSAEKLHKRFNHYIKVGTDVKTDAPRHEYMAQVQLLNQDIAKFVSRTPWTGWPNNYAFTHHLPMVIDREVKIEEGWSTRSVYYQNGEEIELSDRELREAVLPDVNNLIAWIYRQYYPKLVESNIDFKLPSNPLGYYQNWVQRPSDAALNWAASLRDWYNMKAARSNMKDKEIARRLKMEVYEEARRRLGDKDAKVAADACWYVAHASRTEWAAATFVFWAFPEECERIISERQMRDRTTVLVGVQWQVPGLENWEGDVEIETVDLPKGGKMVRRLVVKGRVDGQVQPADTRLPNNTIGLIAETAHPLKVGVYKATITKVSKASWKISVA